MSNEIDIVVRDSINAKIRRKILNIARASEVAQGKIENLKSALNFRGLNLGLRNTGIANLDTALSKVQIQFGKTAEAAARSATAQENALNKAIAVEQRALEASNRTATQKTLNDERIKQSRIKTNAIITANAQAASKAEITAANSAASQQIKLELTKQQARDKSFVSQETALNKAILLEQKLTAAKTKNALAQQQANIKLQQSILSLSTAQENALNKLIVSEERALQASERRASAARRNAQSEQQAATRTASVIEQQNQRVRQSQEARFNANNAGLARTRAAEERARTAEERRLSASRRDHQRTENLKRTLAERFKATQASVAASVQASNNRVIASTNSVIVKEQALVAALDRSSVGYQKMAQAGLAAEAAQNRVTAAQTRLAGPTRVVARNTTSLSRKQVRAAISANKLSISNDKAAKSAIDLRIAELRLASALDRAAGAANRNSAAMVRTGRGIAAVSGRFQGFRQNVIGFIRDIRSLAAFAIIFGAARGLTNAIDGYDNLQNKLKNVTSSQKELNKVTNEIFDIAKRARVPVGDLAKSFVRFDLALKSLGRSQQESLQLTETVSKLLTLNGNSAEESAAALLQLSQAFSKGKLDGDEFRSVMELMPQTFQEGLIKTLGITRKELFDFSKDGKITAEVLAKTFASIAPEVEKAFAWLEKTLGQRLTNLGTELTRAFGKMNKQIGITRKLGNAIGFLTDNLDKLIFAIKVVGATAGAFLGIKAGLVTVNKLSTAVFGLAKAITLSGRAANVLTGSLLFRDKAFGQDFKKFASSVNFFSKITIPGGVIGSLAAIVGLVVLFSDKIDLAQGSVAKLSDWINALTSNIGRVFNNLINGIPLDGVLGQAQNKFNSIFGSVRNAVQAVFRFVVDVVDGMIAIIGGLTVAIDTFFQQRKPGSDIFDELRRGFNLIGFVFIDAMRPALTFINRVIQSWINDFKNIFRFNKVSITPDGFKDIDKKFNQGIDDFFGKSAVEDLNEIKTAYTKAVNELSKIRPVGSFFDKVNEDAVASAFKQKEEQRKLIESQKEADRIKLENARLAEQSRFDDIRNKGLQAIGLLTGFENRRKQLVSETSQSLEITESNLNQSLEQFAIDRANANRVADEDKKQSLLQSANEQLGIWRTLNTRIKELLDDIKTYFNSVVQRMRDTLSSLLSRLTGGITDNLPTGAIGTLLGGSTGGAIEAILGFVGDGSASQGLVNTVSNAFNAAVDAGSQFRKGLTDSIQSSLADGAARDVIRRGDGDQLLDSGRFENLNSSLSSQIGTFFGDLQNTVIDQKPVNDLVAGMERAGDAALQLQQNTEAAKESIKSAGQERQLENSINRTDLRLRKLQAQPILKKGLGGLLAPSGGT